MLRKKMDSPLARYGFAVLVVAVMTVLKLLIPAIQEEGPFLLLFIALILSAWFGGWGPGLLTTGLAAISADYFFQSPGPGYTLRIESTAQAIRLGIFVVEGALVTWLAAALRSARQRAETDVRETRKSADALRFLAVVSTELTSSLDYHATLASLARIAVPQFADWCAVDILAEDGSLDRLAVAHRDPDKIKLAQKLQERYPADPDSPYGIHNVLRAGEPEMMPEIPESLLDQAARNEEHREMLGELGLRSYVIVPLVVRGRVLGAISFVTAESGRRYGQGDLELAEELARRCALAVDNALLYDEAQREIAERKKIEKELKHLSRQNELILNSAGEGIFGLDSQGNATFVNPAAAAMLGYEVEELIGCYLHTTTHHSRSDGTPYPVEECPIYATLRDETVHSSRDEVFWRKHGSNFPVEYVSTPIQEEERIVGAVVTFNDITERKRVQRELAVRIEDLRRSNAELEQFAYVASHDLQEPLRMVSSYTQLLARRYKGQLDETADEFINYAVDGASRMQRLISDLSTYSRVGTRSKELVPTDSGAVLEAARANLRVVIEESGAEVTSEELPIVMGDETQLIQLFQNLIGNAIKFRGEKPPEVYVEAERRDGEWLFSVRDKGIGIDPQHLERIFDVFQRLHGKTEYPGTGIGLAVCKKIVERHGGRLWVESEPGEGSTFCFTLLPKEIGNEHHE